MTGVQTCALPIFNTDFRDLRVSSPRRTPASRDPAARASGGRESNAPPPESMHETDGFLVSDAARGLDRSQNPMGLDAHLHGGPRHGAVAAFIV